MWEYEAQPSQHLSLFLVLELMLFSSSSTSTSLSLPKRSSSLKIALTWDNKELENELFPLLHKIREIENAFTLGNNFSNLL